MVGQYDLVSAQRAGTRFLASPIGVQDLFPILVIGSRTMTTIRDVAELARVSKMTVSKYLTGKPQASRAERTRVEAAVVALDCPPSSIARDLRAAGADLSGAGRLGVDDACTRLGVST